MSNKNQKKVTMPLTQFLNYIDEQEKEKKRATRASHRPARSGGSGGRPTGRLSDRLKARRNDNNSNDDQHSARGERRVRRPLQNAARVVSKKPAVPQLDIESQDMFPTLIETPVKPVSSGSWAQGIQSIVDAKDLPDPVEVERQRRQEAFLLYKKRLQEERDRPYYSDEEYSDEYYSEQEQYPQDNYNDQPIDQEAQEESGEWDEVL